MQEPSSSPTSSSRYYDNSMLSSYKECPRKFLLRHVLGWRSTGVSMPLAFGLSWHSGQDALWQFAGKVDDPTELTNLAIAKFLETWEEQGLNPEPDIAQADMWGARTPGNAHEMYHHYIADRWKMLRTANLLACEQPFAVPLPQTKDVWYVGRLDKVVEYNGETIVLEHKTTTAYSVSSGFQSSYIESWYSDSQVKGYQFGGSLFFPAMTQVWVDAALVHKKIHNQFRFIPVQHQVPLLKEWINDTREWVKRVEIDLATLNNEGKLNQGCFPKNEGSCFGKFGSCTFLNICRTTPDPTKLAEPPEGWVVEFWKPFELLGLDKLINKGENK